MGAKRQRDTNLPPGIYRVRGRFQMQWMDHGRRMRELLPKGTTLDRARRLRERKLIDVEDGAPTQSNSSKVTVDRLLEARARGLDTIHKSARAFPALTDYFRHRRAGTVTYAVLQEYVRERQQAGAADATIHNELATLRNAFRRGRRAGLVATVPDFPMPHVQNVRESFFTVGQLDALLHVLPDFLRAPVRFAALTGMRAGNVFALTWDHVDFGRGEVTVPFGMTKSGEPIRFPFAHKSALATLLRELEDRKRGPLVFHRKGRPIRSYHGAWRAAMRKLGDAGQGTQYDPRTGTPRKVLKRFHDLRHTFAQQLTDAGVDEATLLALGGWKTRSMLDRYRISSQEAKRRALAQRDAHVDAERQKPKVVNLMKTLKVAGGTR
ncbi:MAG TPA: site-specific integrase [Gemmatimonadales bacterium]|nr:site-specific integrase [Gemmatimonadales bacterium]